MSWIYHPALASWYPITTNHKNQPSSNPIPPTTSETLTISTKSYFSKFILSTARHHQQQHRLCTQTPARTCLTSAGSLHRHLPTAPAVGPPSRAQMSIAVRGASVYRYISPVHHYTVSPHPDTDGTVTVTVLRTHIVPTVIELKHSARTIGKRGQGNLKRSWTKRQKYKQTDGAIRTTRDRLVYRLPVTGNKPGQIWVVSSPFRKSNVACTWFQSLVEWWMLPGVRIMFWKFVRLSISILMFIISIFCYSTTFLLDCLLNAITFIAAVPCVANGPGSYGNQYWG